MRSSPVTFPERIDASIGRSVNAAARGEESIASVIDEVAAVEQSEQTPSPDLSGSGSSA
jgi:hypothetical protein